MKALKTYYLKSTKIHICHMCHSGNNDQGSNEQTKEHSIPMGDCRCGMEPTPNLLGDKKEINRFLNSEFLNSSSFKFLITGHGWCTSRLNLSLWT